MKLGFKCWKEEGVKDEGAKYPGMFLRAIPFSLNGVLETTTPVAYIQEPVNSVCRMISHKPGGEHGAGDKRLQLGDMECGVIA